MIIIVMYRDNWYSHWTLWVFSINYTCLVDLVSFYGNLPWKAGQLMGKTSSNYHPSFTFLGLGGSTIIRMRMQLINHPGSAQCLDISNISIPTFIIFYPMSPFWIPSSITCRTHLLNDDLPWINPWIFPWFTHVSHVIFSYVNDYQRLTWIIGCRERYFEHAR